MARIYDIALAIFEIKFSVYEDSSGLSHTDSLRAFSWYSASIYFIISI